MKIKLDDLQYRIMKILWQEGEASVARVRDLLKSERDLAITTVGTVLTRLAKRNLVTHFKEGRQFIYKPAISEKRAHSSMVQGLVNQLFKGDPGTLLNHLITENDFDETELDELERKIQAFKDSKGKS